MDSREERVTPGDIIEWFYVNTGAAVDPNESLWSSTMGTWVKIGQPSLLIAVDDERYWWLDPVNTRLFHARVDDAMVPTVINDIGTRLFHAH